MTTQYFDPITMPPTKAQMACRTIQIDLGLPLTPARSHPAVTQLMRKTHWMVAEKFAAAKSARRASA